MPHLPKHSVYRRDLLNYNGNINNYGVFVRSGSLDGVVGSTTGSITLQIEAPAVRLKRIEVFHSGAAPDFNIRLEASSPNTGSFFDPRDVLVCYNAVPGSEEFKEDEGLDQIEDLYMLTDSNETSEGNIYVKFMPYSTGNNSFKYLLFFEAVILYVNKAGSRNG